METSACRAEGRESGREKLKYALVRSVRIME
jgi:hypothetical protein